MIFISLVLTAFRIKDTVRPSGIPLRKGIIDSIFIIWRLFYKTNKVMGFYMLWLKLFGNETSMKAGTPFSNYCYWFSRNPKGKTRYFSILRKPPSDNYSSMWMHGYRLLHNFKIDNSNICASLMIANQEAFSCCWDISGRRRYLTIILRGRAGYRMIENQWDA